MNNDWLIEFVTLANAKNFTQTAKICRTTQSSISRHLQALEAWLQAPLIERETQPIKLTPAGQRFLKFARVQVADLASVQNEIRKLSVRNVPEIAVPFWLASSNLGDWLADWSPKPRSELSVKIAPVMECKRAIETGDIDLSICYEFSDARTHLDARRFERVVLNRQRVRPYASASLIESGRATFPGTSKRPMTLLTYTPDAFFLRVFEAARAQSGHSLEGRSAFSIQLSDVQADLATRGLGVAWLGESTARRPGCESLIAIGDGRWDVPVEVVAYRTKGSGQRVKSDVWERIRATGERNSG